MRHSSLVQELGSIHEDMPQWIETFLSSRGISWKALESGDVWGTQALPFAELSELVQYIVYTDPCAFAETLFHERDETGHPSWRFWEYQRVSLRTPGHVVLECGAEVGKSREILALAIWALTTGRGEALQGDVLISAALDGHLDPLYNDIKWQLTHNAWLNEQIDWDESRVKPYKTIKWKNGNTLHFRPAGHDGSALRSLHINLMILADEWAKVPTSEAHGNLISRAKPTCWIRSYSTPDGNRSSPFFQLCQNTQAVDPFEGPSPNRTWNQAVKFRWPKTLMPEPYWTPEREAYYVQQYGGRETAAYQQNVMGRWGDPAAGVFPWPMVERVLHYIPEYVSLRLVLDQETRSLDIEASRLCRGYRVGARVGDEDEHGREPEPPSSVFFQRSYQLGNWDPVSALRPLLPELEGAHLVGGADLGAINDPSEVFIGRCKGDAVRWVCRLSLVGCDYPLQDRILRAVDELLKPDLGWGLDATGVGLTLEQLLTDPERGPYFDVQGYVLNKVVEDIDPATGEARLDHAGRPLRIPLLELATRLLEMDIHQGEAEIPFDPALMLEFQSYTAVYSSSRHRQFKGPDHILTALRCALLRKSAMLHSPTGVIPQIHIPPGGQKRLGERLDF